MNLLLAPHHVFQKLIEKLFFRGATSAWSRRLTLMIENLILMVGVFYLLLNTLLYNWTGALYPEGSGFRLDALSGGLDNLIPFVPEMAVFYVYLFYGATVVTMLWFAFVDPEKGLALAWTLVLVNAAAIVVYIFFPVSTYWYRLELLAHPRADFLSQVMYDYYRNDPSFNCFPSLHAAVATAVAYLWYRYARVHQKAITTIIALVAGVIAVGVVLSTLFVRQHYIADEVAGVLLALGAGKLCVDAVWGKQMKKLTTDEHG
jgi:membrane-associated phospholipid phosphatase